MMNDLTTERLTLKRMKEHDAAGLFAIWADPDVTRFMNIPSFTGEDQAKEMINVLTELAKENKALRYTIRMKDSGKIIGSCGYNVLDFENHKTELGYELAKEHWGKGYASEAIHALTKNAYAELGFHRIEAKVEPENGNSIRLLLKLGFTFEGTLRDAEKAKGRFVNLALYAKLSTD
ncbi:GNAT family N-acetyltransferase [Oceanobacillus picturae]|uniref:GNAT family N-acetyltransferase n=1 Tax=Oceanobacillus picturae TaxID=171693 RepID=UPI000E69655E|nr:GNAT family N-acetyltransferase [Oceanobacillus picturae]RIU90494.1 N-acetyltransferase [Oceanobacillus picturae]